MSNTENSIEYGSLTDTGRIRSENQDSYGVFPVNGAAGDDLKGQLFIIADGMGGHSGGRDASALAVSTIEKAYFADVRGEIAECLRGAFEKANRAIKKFGTEVYAQATVGTTCSALVLKEDRGYFAHVGDSRVYRINRASVQQLTDDHTAVGELVRRRLLTREEGLKHPQRSVLSRALGVSSEVEVDTGEFALGTDEYYLLCTDGLYALVDETELQSHVLSEGPQQACQALVGIANERGGPDNITVEVIHVTRDSSVLDSVKRFFGG
jgi:PPM family protein phosphatase